MKKKTKIIIISIAVFFVLLVAIPLFLLYTAPGNYLISPIVEQQINNKSPLKITLLKFRLYPSFIIVKADVAGGAIVEAEGEYSLTAKSFDIDYKVDAKDLSVFSELAKHPLQGSFSTHGKAKGSKDDFNVVGETDFAQSNTEYKVNVKNQKLNSLTVKAEHFHPEDALYAAVMPKLVNGTLDLNLDFKSIDSVKADFTFSNGLFNAEVIKRKFHITVPENTPIKLSGNIVNDAGSLNYDISLDSELVAFATKGKFDTVAEKVDGEYNVNINELALLEPFIKQKLAGPVSTDGTISGTPDNIAVNGNANIAGGDAAYSIHAANRKIANLNFHLKGASLAKLLFMLRKPQYADADIALDAELSSIEPKNINGTVRALLQNGKTAPDVLLKHFKLENALISFNLNADTVIKNSVAVAKTNFKSNVANLTTEKLEYNIPEKRLHSDYTLTIPNLDELFFVTKRHLDGSMIITGDVLKDDNLELNAHSDTLGGKIDAKLVNKDLNVKFDSLNTVDICKTLLYPEIFKSQINSVIEYNLANKNGTVNMEMLDGSLTENSFTDIVKQVAKFDVTTEIYKKTTITGVIENSLFTGDLDMKSKLTKITSKNATFNFAKNSIKAKIKITAKKKTFALKLKGDVRKPSVSVDASEYISSELDKIIDKEIPKKHKKTIKAILDIFK